MSAQPGLKWRLFSIVWLVLLVLPGGINASSGKSSLAQDPDEDPYRFTDVKKWRGTFAWEGSGTGTEQIALGTMDYQSSHSATGSFELEGPEFPYESHPYIVEWNGKARGSGQLDDEFTVTHDCMVLTDVWKGAGEMPGAHGDPPPMTAKLYMNLQDGTYVITLGPETLDAIATTTYNTCDDPETMEREFTTALGSGGFASGHAKGKLPDTGFELSDSAQFEEMVAQSAHLTGQGVDIDWNYQWSIAPAEKEELEVVVSLENYDKWLPEGGTAITKGPISFAPGGIAKLAAPPLQEAEVMLIGGNNLPFTATLQVVGGGEPAQKAVKFTFELIEVSREPGIAMNSPKKGMAKRDYDLEFDPNLNPPTAVLIIPDTGGQEAEWILPDSTKAHAVLRSNDWGAWGTLKVTALMPSGEEIVGYLQGDPDQKEIRIPKRKPDSWIADAWKEANNVANLPDGDDGENVPVGDARVKGDGLTLYEEYRGFFEDGKHIYANPVKKDYFIHDKIKGRAKDGIALFARISGLEVHHLIQEAEMDLDRMINFNHSDEAPHLVHQHAVIMKQRPAGGQDSHVQGILGGKPLVPGNVEVILILPPSDFGPNGWTTLRRGGKSIKQDSYASTIAHELLHACNVEHHGEGDEENLKWEWAKVNGKDVLTEYGVPIKVKNERGQRVEWDRKDTPDGVTVYLGIPQGQHSGNDSCVMRYETGHAYRAEDAEKEPDVRYWIYGEEPTGDALCTLATGTGVNKDGRKPQSRYGDAMPGHGDCAHQIMVSDIVMWKSP